MLLLVESGLAYYVFNHTARERTPTTIYVSEESVSCFAISNWGDALAVGTANGIVSYFQRVKTVPQWVYLGASGIASVLVSGEGDYVFAMDEGHNLSLFRSLGVGVNTPRWSRRLEGGRIMGVHSSGGIPPLVYMLASVEGRILLFSDREDLLWEYSTKTSSVAAELSFDGRHVAAVDALGRVYLFDVGEPQPVWVSSTGVTCGVISMSQASSVAVGGGDSSGGGQVLSLSLEDGERLWEWSTASSVASVSMSSDGSKVVAYEVDGRASLLTQADGDVAERALGAAGGVESVWSPPFGSYAVVLGAEGRIYFLYGSRTAPLWVYDAGAEVVDIAVTSIGDKVFVAGRNSVAVIDNTIETGMIPGSRSLWGIWFIIGLAGVAAIYRSAGVELMWLRRVKECYPVLVPSLVIGGVIGFTLWGGVLPALAAVVSCAVGCIIGYSREGQGGFVFGLFASAASSLAASILYGLFVWFGGAESNVVVLVVTSVSGGTRAGLVLGFLGTSLGLLVAKIGGRFREAEPP